jgi:hypothetical protein
MAGKLGETGHPTEGILIIVDNGDFHWLDMG